MQAVVCASYGPPEVLRVATLDRPVPGDTDVLIRVCASAVTSSDCRIRSGQVPLPLWVPFRMFVGLTKPRRSVLGMELSGTVEAVGKSVKRFKPGDDVWAFTGRRFGAYAEYCQLPENGRVMPSDSIVALKPRNLTHVEAATVPTRGGLAWHCLERGKIRHAKRVLIYGASGGVGTFAVQLARFHGADVTAVCSHANFDLVRSLGAHATLDYTRDEWTDRSPRFELIVDAVGRRKDSKLKAQLKDALVPGGRFISVDDGTAKIPAEHLESLREVIEAGHVRPVVDGRYRLDQIVDAHRHVETGHKRGGIVVTVSPG